MPQGLPVTALRRCTAVGAPLALAAVLLVLAAGAQAAHAPPCPSGPFYGPGGDQATSTYNPETHRCETVASCPEGSTSYPNGGGYCYWPVVGGPICPEGDTAANGGCFRPDGSTDGNVSYACSPPAEWRDGYGCVTLPDVCPERFTFRAGRCETTPRPDRAYASQAKP